MKNNTAVIDNIQEEIRIKFKETKLEFDFAAFNNLGMVYFGIEMDAYKLRWVRGDDPYVSIHTVKNGITSDVGLTLKLINKNK